MPKSYSRPRLAVSRRMRVRGFVRSAIAMVVLVAIPVVFVLLFRQEASVRFNGVVESDAENVGPVETARIVSIDVKRGQQVKKGDVLVRFDAPERMRDESVNDVKIGDYRQNLAKRREALAEGERKCRQLVRDAEVSLEECRMEQAREEAELAGYEAETKRLEPLVAAKLVSELELLSIRPKAESLRKTIPHYRPLIAALERRVKSAEENLASVIRDRESAEKDIARDIRSIENASVLNGRVIDSDPTVIRAQRDGIVTMIFRRDGDVAIGGEPVLRISSGANGAYVTGMLPANMLDLVEEGDELYVTRLAALTRGLSVIPAVGRVESIDAEVLDLFDPNNPAPRLPARGRKLRIRIVDRGDGLVPGEAVLLTDAHPDVLGGLLLPTRKTPK